MPAEASYLRSTRERNGVRLEGEVHAAIVRVVQFQDERLVAPLSATVLSVESKSAHR
jgi:hypothetical protein